jgi:hypothetical protein
MALCMLLYNHVGSRPFLVVQGDANHSSIRDVLKRSCLEFGRCNL